MGRLATAMPLPLDFVMARGQRLAVRECPGGGYYVTVNGANIAKVDTVNAARTVFFALVSHDTAAAS